METVNSKYMRDAHSSYAHEHGIETRHCARLLYTHDSKYTTVPYSAAEL